MDLVRSARRLPGSSRATGSKGGETTTTEQASSGGIDPNKVLKVVTVQARKRWRGESLPRKMETWWPLANYTIGIAKAVDAGIEPCLAAASGRQELQSSTPTTICDYCVMACMTAVSKSRSTGPITEVEV